MVLASHDVSIVSGVLVTRRLEPRVRLGVGRPVTIRSEPARRLELDKKAKTPKKPKQPKTADKKK